MAGDLQFTILKKIMSSSLLADLKKRMEEDKNLPLRAGATQLVFGEGNPNAEIYFLGEGPGYHEDQQGRPFVGLAGKLLNESLEEIGLKREEVYISNVVRFRPPGNRDPLPEELAAFDPYIDEELAIINPKLIVTLGRFSMGKFIPNAKISQIHGKPLYINFKDKEIMVLPMFHPAAALRSEEVLKMFKEDFKKIPQLLQEPVQVEKVEGEKKTTHQQLELL